MWHSVERYASMVCSEHERLQVYRWLYLGEPARCESACTAEARDLRDQHGWRKLNQVLRLKRCPITGSASVRAAGKGGSQILQGDHVVELANAPTPTWLKSPPGQVKTVRGLRLGEKHVANPGLFVSMGDGCGQQYF